MLFNVHDACIQKLERENYNMKSESSCIPDQSCTSLFSVCCRDSLFLFSYLHFTSLFFYILFVVFYSHFSFFTIFLDPFLLVCFISLSFPFYSFCHYLLLLTFYERLTYIFLQIFCFSFFFSPFLISFFRMSSKHLAREVDPTN